jgi:hypothetical protein
MAPDPGAEPEAAIAPPPSSSGSRDALAAPGQRIEALATLVIVGAFLAAVAARPLLRRLAAHPTREQCAQMLDRYAEEEARAADPKRAEKGGSLDDAPARSIDAPTLDRCTRDLTAEEITCALRSGGADELERCLPP